MKKNNLLVVGATSGIMISCLETFLTKNYNITATYHDDKSLLNISDKVKNSSNIRFLKLDLNSNNSEIIESLNKRIVLKQNRTNKPFIDTHEALRDFLPFQGLSEAIKMQVIGALPNSSIQKALALN